MNKTLYVSAILFLSATALGTTTGCTSSTGTSQSASSVNVSGKLNVSSAQSKPGIISEDAVSSLSVDLTVLKVLCSTTTTPIQSGLASIGADGSFTVNIPNAQNQPLSCAMVDASGVKKADFLISDSSHKDLNGNNSVASTAAFKQDASLGAINYDATAGEVTVPAANVAGSISTTTGSAAPVVYDPTGSWTISPVDFPLSSQVKGPCNGHNNNCNGPPNGQALYLKMWTGVQSDSSAVYGLQVWNSPAAYNACGQVVGLTAATKSNLGVSFPAAGASDTTFNYQSSIASFADPISSITGPVTITNYFKMNTAKTQYSLQPGCTAQNITIGGVAYTNAWVCGPDSVNHTYQVQLGGGCQDGAGNAVQVSNWGGFSCSSSLDSTTQINSQTCTGTTSINSVSTAVTCTNTFAVLDVNKVPTGTGTFNYSNLAASIPSGTLCSSITDSASKDQCYASYYSQSRIGDAGVCLPKVDFDWSTGATFVDLNHPSQLVFFEQFHPFPDGSGGTMLARQDHYQGVQVNGNWVNCHVLETGGLSFKKVADGKLLATYQSATITTSISKPACLAAFSGARTTFMFYLNK